MLDYHQSNKAGDGGEQAKILSDPDQQDLLVYASPRRYPHRNVVIVLLSVKAGLRAGEIAKLTWDMVLDTLRSGRSLNCATRGQKAKWQSNTLFRSTADSSDRVAIDDLDGSSHPLRARRRRNAADQHRDVVRGCLSGASSAVARLTLVAVRSSQRERGSCTRPAARCGTFSCWPVPFDLNDPTLHRRRQRRTAPTCDALI